MSIGVFMPNIAVNSEVRVFLPPGDLQTDRMDLLFDPSDWASPVTKRIIVEAGVEVGTSDRNYVLSTTETVGGQANSFNGKLILENSGIISGRGGAANGGVGGNAIYANLPGRNGQKLEIINNGIIRAGGGGGGKGGTGGGGSVTSTVREPTSGFYASTSSAPYYLWQIGFPEARIRWNTATSASNVQGPSGSGTVSTTSFVLGEYTYLRGPDSVAISSYGVARSRQQTTNTNGGAGGNGGVGQGFGQSATNGAVGAVGGQNAGRGGTGGNGGAFGSSGVNGDAGDNGNRTNGSAGEVGGLAGFYVDGNDNVDWLVTGSRQGRLK